MKTAVFCMTNLRQLFTINIIKDGVKQLNTEFLNTIILISYYILRTKTFPVDPGTDTEENNYILRSNRDLRP